MGMWPFGYNENKLVKLVMFKVQSDLFLIQNNPYSWSQCVDKESQTLD